MAAAKKPQLAVVPFEKIRFVGDSKKEMRSTLRLTNKSETKQAYKVKCTRNDLFLIRPSTGILDYNQTITVNITFKGNIEGPTDELHIGVYHIPAPEGCTCDGAWSEHYGPAQGELRLGIAFEDKK